MGEKVGVLGDGMEIRMYRIVKAFESRI